MLSIKQIEEAVKQNGVHTPKKLMKCPNCYHYSEVAVCIVMSICRKCLSEMREVKR